MTYNNPLGIFSEAQLEKLKQGNLKSLKKEILLHFQLSDEATIERNGKQFDKNQILEIFDDLQGNQDLHLKIFNNKELVAFLENKDLRFFKDTRAKYAVQHDIVYRDQIDTHIANQLNIVTADLVNKVTPTSAETLQLILDYTTGMNTSIQDKAYNKAYVELKSHVDNLSIQYPSPFLSDNALTLNNELYELINPLFYNCFKYLPGAFQDIGFGYAVWCHNDVVNSAFRRESNYMLFAKDDLKVIVKAMDIGCEVTKSEAFRQNTREVKDYLKGGGLLSKRQTRKQTSEPPKTNQRRQARPQETHYETDTTVSSWTALKTIIIILLITFKVMFLISKCSRNNTSNNYRSNNRYTEQKFNDRSVAQPSEERRQKINKNRTKKAKEAIHARYAGDDRLLWNPKLLRSEKVHNVIELDYEVNIFPSNYYDFHSLIPSDIKRKYKDETKDFVIKFTSKDFPGRSQSHRFRSGIKSSFNKTSIVLDAKKSSRSDKLALTIKRILKKKKLKGSITKYSSGSPAEISKVLFEIRDDLELETQVEESGKIPSFAEAKFDKWDDFSISNVADQHYKNIILNNFNKIAYKVLKQGNYYAIQTMATYTPNSLAAKIFKVSDIREVKCNFRLDYVSNEDEMATLSLYGENLYIRYFVSNETNRIVGMNMVVANDDIRKGVEVIEVFFE